jgi:hypothetical protein
MAEVQATVKLEFPIELESVLSVNLNIDNLRLTLQFLLDAINAQNAEISGLKSANLE